ncbi:MAG: choline monooxygenase [Gaiellales bacterium]|jgi:choline monooxygenase|nr:choline monooxygenase [Gaiellales bacterium]
MTAMLGPVSVWEDHGVGHSGTLPSDWYTSRELFELEQRTLMRDVWHCVGSAHEVREPGMFFTTTVANEQVVVVRGRDGDLRAMSNVCLHRAGPVAVGCGQRNAFQCPYHGWMFELDGRLRRAQGMETTEGFDGSKMKLPQFRVEEWGPSVWVTLEEATPPLSDWLSDITPRLANYHVDELEFIGGRRWTIDCNWKLYVDNYMEGYHIPFIHPGLALGLSPTVYTYELGTYTNVQYGGEPHPRGPGSRVAGILGGTQEFRRLKPPMRGLDEQESSGYYFNWVFPLTTVNFMPDGILMFMIRPVEPERTESTFLWWMPKATDFQDKLLQAALVNFGHVINTEDYEICEQAQRGMRSSVYHQGRYNADQEICLHHFHQLLSRHMQPHLRAWQTEHAHTNGSGNGHRAHTGAEGE